MNSEELYRNQRAQLESKLSSITDNKVKNILNTCKKLEADGVLSSNDVSDIGYVLKERSSNDFYKLETHPREELWRILKEVGK